MSTDRQVGTVKVEFASNRIAVVALIGEHDLDSRAALRATLEYVADGRNLLVDLSHCTFVDSAVISLLLATHRALNARHDRCELIIPVQAGYVTRLFELTGITSLFSVHATRSAALDSMDEIAALVGAKSR